MNDSNSILCELDELAWKEIMWLDKFAHTQDEINKQFVVHELNKLNKRVKKLEMMLEFTRRDPRPGEITPQMVESARSFPVDSLVEFKGNRAIAFCHDSDSFSMSFNKRVNRVHCFVCNKSFNPIDILVERDGMSFIDAVGYLHRTG